jgi:hypothetical protein
MWLNPIVKMITVAKKYSSKAKIKNLGGRSRSKQRRRVTCLYCGNWQAKKGLQEIQWDLTDGKVANKTEQKGENEDFLVIEDKKYYSVVRVDVMHLVVGAVLGRNGQV